MQQLHISLGVMSGTSLDGLDLALCEFFKENGKWHYHILKADTIPYSKEWKKRLIETETTTALNYVKTDWALGRYIGKQINVFLQKANFSPNYISSHGHTIFHQPDGENGYTAQIGNGAAINAETNIPVINDFRVADVAYGGQGAPLVPIGDLLLFSDYQFCLNLGGIANISTTQNGISKAYDICACNMALNHIIQRTGMEYDDAGKVAASGKLIPSLFQELNNLPFLKINGPKSLGKEWFLTDVLPILQAHNYPIEDLAYTFTQHIATQIAITCKRLFSKTSRNKNILVTGGGAYHSFLIECLQKQLPSMNVQVPESKIVEFKEAIIFAFLGVLRTLEQVNCLSSVTGASKNTVGGVLHHSI